MKLELFGYPRVVTDSAKALPFTRPVYLLIYLACRNGWVTRDELILVFYPEIDEKTARRSFRTLLTRACKLSWADVEREGDRLRFAPESDLSAFRLALGAGKWQKVTELYRDEFMAGAPGLGLLSFENWLEVERTALAASWQEAALKHAAQLARSEQHAAAAALLARVLQRQPLAEDILQAYLRSSYLAGDTPTALSTFEKFKAQLSSELALEPLVETVTLAETLERSERLAPVALRGKASIPLSVLRPPVMTGRSEEKALLLDKRVRLGVVLGEAGVGKSRLLSEVSPDALWLRCREGLAHVPYFPLTETIQRLESLPDALEGLGAYRADLARLLPNVSGASTSVEDEIDSDVAKARLLEALARVLESQNAALVFDDLQWADSATLEFFMFMAHRASLKLYAALRSGERSERLEEVLSGFRALNGFRELALAPLPKQAVTELLTHLSPETGEAQAFSSWLATKSGGNPFFLLETLRALFEAQVLSEDGSGWYSALDHVTQTYDELAVPPGVAALVQRRVRGLSEEARRVLDVAAVLAETITSGLVAELVGLSNWAASEAVGELEARGLLSEQRFSHDLARQALYEALPESKRRFLHEQVAGALPESADELVRAEHYYRAGKLEQAAELWFDVARTRYTEGNFSEEATALYERILTLGIDTNTYYRAQAYLAHDYDLLNRIEESQALVDSVLKNSRDSLARTFALLQKTRLFFLKGELAEAEKTVEHAEKQVVDVDDSALQRDVALTRVHVDMYLGRHEKALALAERILAEKRLEAHDADLLSWLGISAYVYCTLGRFEEALDLYFERLKGAQQLKLKAYQVKSAADIMVTLNDLGRAQEGVALGEHALTLGTFADTYALRYSLARAYLEQKRFSEVLEHCHIILAVDSSVNLRSHVYALLAEAYTLQGDIAKAEQAVAEGLTLVMVLDHTEAKATVVIAALKFGSAEQVERVDKLAKDLSQQNLPAYIEREFRAALAGRKPRA